MVRKLILIFLAIFSVMTTAYADTYLNSCGNPSGGWSDDETYILNFTTVGSGYTDDYCYRLPGSGDLNNVTFTSVSGILDVQRDATFHFLKRKTSSNFGATFTHQDIVVKNLHLTKQGFSNFSTLIFMDSDSPIKMRMQNMTVRNVTMENFHALASMQGTDVSQDIRESLFEDVRFYGNRFVTRQGGSQTHTFTDNTISNSVIMTETMYDIQNVTLTGTGHQNSVIISHENKTYTGINDGTTFNQSIVQGYPHNDTNNDGLADTDIYPGMTNMVIWKTIDGIRYLQDTSEGKQGFQSDEEHFVVNNHESAFIDGTEYPEINGATYYFNDFFVDTNLTGIGAINLDTDSRMEIYPFEPNNDLLSVQPGGVSSSSDYRGIVRVSDNSTVSGIRFGHTGGEPTLAQFLSNINSGNTVTDFKFSDNFVLTYGYNSSTGGGQFRLRSSQADIHDNIFTPITTTGQEESFLNITGFEDTIRKNQFSVSGNGTYYLCAFCSGGQEFYNNNISENVRVAKSGYVPDIELNTTVAYEEGGTVYYFNIGNYWVGNTNCTDADGNGICDSSYTTPNGFIDERPLADYPFDFSAQKLNADETVSESNFTVTLVEPQDGDSYTLSDSSDAIDVTFIHDSDYPDLTCDFVIDGVVEDRLSSPEKDVSNTISFTGWSEGNHTVRVECYNDFVFDASPTNTFTVSVDDSGTTNGGGDSNGTGLDPGGITGNNGQIITGDVGQTRDNVISMFGLFNLPLVYGAYLGLVFIAIVFLIVLFSAIYMLIPKR